MPKIDKNRRSRVSISIDFHFLTLRLVKLILLLSLKKFNLIVILMLKKGV